MTKSVTKIQDKDTKRRLSVVRSTEDPTKYWVVILNPDGSRIRWPKGEQGEKGDTGEINVGTTTTGEPWTNASVVNSGTSTDAVLDFTIPRWDKGETWNAATVSVGSTTTWNAGTCACVVNSGDCHNAVLDFIIPKGDKGDTGDDACVSVGTTCTWNPWTEANVENVGTPWNAVLNFTIPQWVKGDTGTAATVSVGTTSTLNPWCNACVNNSWDCHNAVLNFWIPKGEKGDTGSAATINVGSTSTLAPWCCATVSNSWTTWAAIFNFGIPKWEKWDKGDKWDKGNTGNSATINVGATTTLDAWCSATVSNSGDCHDAIFNFGIPKWDKWDKWDTGNPWSAATISVGSTTTLDAGCSATVSNSWSSSAAVFNFGIPKGDKWETGCTWATWNGIASVTCSKEWKVTTITIEETNGCCACFTVCDGEDWEGSGDVLWPSSATSWNIVLFDGNSGKCIKQWGAVVDALNSSSSTDILSAKQWCVLNSCISDINGKIPSEASSSNQLADKCFVNSSINSLAAFYITKDAQGDQFDTYLELSSATTFYSGGVVRVPTQNDYTIVASDETHDNATTRYSYQGNQWEYQYTVNETALTQAQLDALNSWITSAKVCSYDGYATSKQDKLVSGTSIATINGCNLLSGGNITTPNTTYSQATCSDLWLIKLWSNTVQSISANAVTWCNNRTYALQVNSSGQGVVNVPWENTTYTANCFDINNLADACNCKSTWNGKQNAIADLSDIRAWAECGASAIQPWDNISELNNNCGYITGISCSDVTTALWFNPYDSSNPNWYTSCTGTLVASDLDWYAKSCEIPTDNCQLGNSCGYITSSSLPWIASSSVAWIVKLWSNTVQSCTMAWVSSVANRTYGVQLNSSCQMVVNIPWENTQCVSSVGWCTWEVSIKTVNSCSLMGSWDLCISWLPAGWTNGQVITMTSGWAAWCDPSGWISNDTAWTTSTLNSIWVGDVTEWNAKTKSNTGLYVVFD